MARYGEFVLGVFENYSMIHHEPITSKEGDYLMLRRRTQPRVMENVGGTGTRGKRCGRENEEET
jgi:hypothetical protein